MTKETWQPDIFEALFRTNPDPWNFETTPYERRKLDHLLSCIPEDRICFAVELGCAIGVGTRRLSERCDRVLAVDASATALDLARKRCAGTGNVNFIRAFLPDGYPASQAAGCDLMIVSELLYFLGKDDIRRLAACATDSLAKDGVLLLVNWTGQTDTPCTGDEAADCFIQSCHEHSWEVDHRERSGTYRLERLRYTGASMMQPGYSAD
ncbi:methyltransferase domain-containing protein [Acetobacter sicerae]|nr:methyltransferase domain-containing protein [Acetobacter sicerae]